MLYGWGSYKTGGTYIGDKYFTVYILPLKYGWCVSKLLQALCQLDVPVNSKDANGYMFQQCSPGYYGAACSLCVREGPQQYGRTGSLQCQPCQSPAKIICAFTASNVLVLAFLTYVIHTTLAENEEDFRHGQQTVQPSELLKVCCPALPCPALPCPALLLQPGPYVACGEVTRG